MLCLADNSIKAYGRSANDYLLLSSIQERKQHKGDASTHR